MVIRAFPALDTADEYGILAAGGDLELESLLLAYRSGIFPWPHGEHLLWFSPPERCILRFCDYRPSRSLLKLVRKGSFSFCRNKNFALVIENCAQSKQGKRAQQGTWINQEIKQAYLKLYQAGYAESFETYQDNQLCGGIYGVRINQYFAGESMFYLKANASKLALYYLIEQLKAEGLTWIDCQNHSQHLESLGASMVQRTTFIKLLNLAIQE